MNAELARDDLVAGLVRIGELSISAEGREEADAYFSATDDRRNFRPRVHALARRQA